MGVPFVHLLHCPFVAGQEIVQIPEQLVGAFVGFRGSNIKDLCEKTGCKLNRGSGGEFHLNGTREQMDKVKQLIEEFLQQGLYFCYLLF